MKKLLIILLLAMSFSIHSMADSSKQNDIVIIEEVSNFNDDFSNEFEEEKEVFDPLSGYNRVMTSFNDFLYVNVLEPTAKGYTYIVPEPARVGVSNFFHNITFPIRFINNILQLKFDNALEETGRFLVNSTFGILGFMDPASTELGWEKHNEDFGQTLGYYGVGEGFHIVMPLLGPSNLRDRIGSFIDGNVYLFGYNTIYSDELIDTYAESIAIGLYKSLNSTSLNLGQYQNMKEDAIDLYPFLRDVYKQNREKQIKE